MATATPEQVEAAKATINLGKTIEKFIQQSAAVEKSNKRLTYFIVALSFIQAFSAIITLLKSFNFIK